MHAFVTMVRCLENAVKDSRIAEARIWGNMYDLVDPPSVSVDHLSSFFCFREVTNFARNDRCLFINPTIFLRAPELFD